MHDNITITKTIAVPERLAWTAWLPPPSAMVYAVWNGIYGGRYEKF